VQEMVTGIVKMWNSFISKDIVGIVWWAGRSNRCGRYWGGIRRRSSLCCCARQSLRVPWPYRGRVIYSHHNFCEIIWSEQWSWKD
jgi:hypothetical protein